MIMRFICSIFPILFILISCSTPTEKCDLSTTPTKAKTDPTIQEIRLIHQEIAQLKEDIQKQVQAFPIIHEFN